MNVTPHFSLAELTASQYAARNGLSNMPPSDLLPELQKTAELLERVRAILQRPVLVTSGYRSEPVNRAVGGAASSAHLRAGAADFISPGYGTPWQIARDLATYAESLDFDQLIFEFNAWVHIGRARPDETPRRQVLTIDGAGTRFGIG